MGVSVSGDSGYWVSYDTYQSPRIPPLIVQAIYFPPGLPGIGATIYPSNPGIDPTSWVQSNRCPPACYAAGDFQTVASNPYAAATVPFLQKSSGLANDPCPSSGGVNNKLCQIFVQDPQSTANVPNFTPNFIPIPYGSDTTGLAFPVPPTAYARPPGLTIGGPVTP